jgi:TM2 domain-containing membrane protein YozV
MPPSQSAILYIRHAAAIVVACVVSFAGIAFFVVLAGGHAHADLGGVLLLFIIGGIIGLIGYAIYHKGREDATRRKPDDHVPPP